MTPPTTPPGSRRLTTPRSAAIAGVVFAILFAGSLILLRVAIPEQVVTGTDWLEPGAPWLSAAVITMPFAGITFLWFIGVLRDGLADAEDKFFASVFFGSGVLFLAMVFVSMAVAGGILAFAHATPDSAGTVEIVDFARALMFQISNVYALRMAGVFMISLATIWWRTALMPRWVIVLTYLLALVLLVVTSFSLWATLVFPGWVLLISALLLLKSLRSSREPTATQ